MEYGAKVVLDMLSNRTWQIGNRNTDGGEIFLTLCELLGSNSSSVDRLTKLMNVNSMDLLRFLNRLELLGALKQDSLGDYTLAAVGTQMYKRLIRERELDV